MRAQEFITEGKEKYNWDLHKPGFEFSQKINGITYTVKRKNQFLNVKARDKQGRKVGSTWFVSHQYKDALEAGQTFVDPEFRGQGIATNMYAVVRMLGANIHPSTTQSDDGKAMWSKWNQQGDAKHIKSMNAQMTKQGVTEAMAADQVLDYVKRAHAPEAFDIEYSITDHPEWKLTNIPLSQLNLDPDGETPDPYNRVNWIDDDKVQELLPRIEAILKRMPIVVDPAGWIIDGNHRAVAAVEAGLTSVPALVPVKPGVAEDMDHSQDGGAVAELKTALLAKKDKLQAATDDQVYDIIDGIMTRIARSHSISGKKLHDMWVDKYRQIPDAWIMNENFADGRNPQDKGDSKRHGINTKASVSSLRKTAKQGGRKGQLAHWLANMKSGRAKANKK